MYKCVITQSVCICNIIHQKTLNWQLGLPRDLVIIFHVYCTYLDNVTFSDALFLCYFLPS